MLSPGIQERKNISQPAIIKHSLSGPLTALLSTLAAGVEPTTFAITLEPTCPQIFAGLERSNS